MRRPKKSLKVLDLFSGAGGLSLGFEQAGFEVVGGVDADAKCIDTYSHNFPSASAVRADLGEVSARQLAHEIDGSHIDVIVGGPPCQGFSVAGKRSESDSRNDLYQHYLKIVRAVRPRAVVIENVPTIRSLYKGRVAEAIEAGLSALGYRVTTGILNAAYFGVPQARRRMFFVATKSDEPRFEFPTPSTNEPLTCWDALSDLPSLSTETGQPVSNYESIPKTEYQREMRRDSRLLYNHSYHLSAIRDHVEHTFGIICA